MDQISLFPAAEWFLPPDLLDLTNQTFFHVHHLLLKILTFLLLPTVNLGKATEEAWDEGGFCMLVKKNNLCIRKVLQQLCCRTCTLKG